MSNGTILITGATGHVGKELVEQLLKMGDTRVRILVRNRNKVLHLGNNVEIAVGDLDKPETLSDAMQNVERLYFVTAFTGQIANLVKKAKKAGVKHIVKQSTIEADRSLGPGKWHREQEEFIKASDMAWTIIRPTMMMTNTIEWWSATIKSKSAIYFPGRKGKVPVIDPRDIAAVVCKVLTHSGHEGKTYVVTEPDALSIAEMVDIIGKVLDKRISYISVFPWLAGMWLRRSGLNRRLADALIQTLQALRKNQYAYVANDVELVTGQKPRGFEAWCRENIVAFQ